MKQKQVSPGVALGRLRAAKLTSADRSANARTGWRRKFGPDHITADQWRVLVHLRDKASADTEVGNGAAGTRFEAAAHLLHDRQVIICTAFPPGKICYHRGPAWVDQKHIRVASKKST